MSNYTVQSGDSLSTIAQKNGMTLAQLLAQNPQYASNLNLIRPGQIVNLTSNNTTGATTGKPLTTAEKHQALMDNPITSSYISYGNTVEQLANAYETNDWSKMTDENGKPFSVADQQDALNKAKEQDAAFYDQQKQKETADTESALAAKTADYQDYLLKSGQNFEADKATADQTAANSGVLFSGGRVQKEKNLKRSYEQDQDTKLRNVTSDIAGLAGDYQYKYGNNAANSLSKYYSLGGNSYNPNVATGGVSSNGLSSVYNPSKYNYAGTRIGEQMATANKKAGGLLYNKGNKLLASGYNNQY